MLKLGFCLSLAAVLLLSGCGNGPGTLSTEPVQSAPTVEGIHGVVHGGQQGVSNSIIALKTVGTTGYGSGSISNYLVSTTTDANGNFNITGQYTCPASNPLVYITAIGGNPGLTTGTNNTGIFLMAALTNCNNLTASTYIVINEVTTVAAAYALAPFINASNGFVGSYSYANVGLANGFLTANNLVDTTTGLPRSVTPAGNGAVPASEIATLADILAPCVNSSSSTSTSCATLFGDLQPTNGTAPNNSLLAALSIAQHPGSNVAALYGLATASPPFQPTLASAPNDWSVAVNISSGVSSPGALAVDTNGNVYFDPGGNIEEMDPTGKVIADVALSDANSGQMVIDSQGNVWDAVSDGTLYEYTPSTQTLSTALSGQGSFGPLAIDPNGLLWIVSPTSNSVIEYNPYVNSVVSPSGGYTAALNTPNSIAIRPDGNVLVGDSTSVTPFSSIGVPGTAITGTGGIASPTGVVMGPIDEVWISNGNGALSELNSSYAALSPGGGYPTGASTLSNVTVDGFSDVEALFPPSAGRYAVAVFNSSGTRLSPSTGYQNSGLTSPTSSAVDLSGNLWVTNNGTGANIVEFIGLAAPTNSPLVYSVVNNEFGNRPGTRILVSILDNSVPYLIPGSPYAAQLHAAGGNSGAYMWSATGLPSGLSIDPSTGIISGTTSATTASTATITVVDAANISNSASGSFTFTPYSAMPAGGNESAVSGLCFGGAMDGHEFPVSPGSPDQVNYLLSFCFESGQQVSAEWVRSSPQDTVAPAIVSGTGTYNFNSNGMGEIFLVPNTIVEAASKSAPTPSGSSLTPGATMDEVLPVQVEFAGTDYRGLTAPEALKLAYLELPGTASSFAATGGGFFDMEDKTSWSSTNFANSNVIISGKGEFADGGPAGEVGLAQIGSGLSVPSSPAFGAAFGQSYQWNYSGSATSTFDSFGLGNFSLNDSGTAFIGRYGNLWTLTINANHTVGLTAGAHSFYTSLRYDFYRQTAGPYSNSSLTGNFVAQFDGLKPLLSGGATYTQGVDYLTNQGISASGLQFEDLSNKSFDTGEVRLGWNMSTFSINIGATGQFADTAGTTVGFVSSPSAIVGISSPSMTTPIVFWYRLEKQTAASTTFGCPTGTTPIEFGSLGQSLLADANTVGRYVPSAGTYNAVTILPDGTLIKNQGGSTGCAPDSFSGTTGESSSNFGSTQVLAVPVTSTQWLGLNSQPRLGFAWNPRVSWVRGVHITHFGQ
jgi:putative Ig domain-containing protein